MNYITLRETFRGNPVFSLQQILKLDPSFHRTRLSEWQTKGYIQKIIRGYYSFADARLSEQDLFVIANTIYKPSYVSLEMAFAFYGFIPESVFAVTSVSTRPSRDFETSLGRFKYQTIKSELFFGYQIVSVGQQAMRIAEPEKALLDFLYYDPSYCTVESFEGLRLNIENLRAKIDFAKFKLYAQVFTNKALLKRVDIFLRFLENA